jgi:hypothetical protein
MRTGLHELMAICKCAAQEDMSPLPLGPGDLYLLFLSICEWLHLKSASATAVKMQVQINTMRFGISSFRYPDRAVRGRGGGPEWRLANFQPHSDAPSRNGFLLNGVLTYSVSLSRRRPTTKMICIKSIQAGPRLTPLGFSGKKGRVKVGAEKFAMLLDS